MVNTPLNHGSTYLPAAGEGSVPQWHGTYTATVVSNHDPLGVGRLQLHVPQVLGNAVSAWAVPAGLYFTIPSNGTTVSATFIGGDPAQPTWNGALDLAPALNSGANSVTYSVSEPANPKVGDVWYPINTSVGTTESVGTPQVWTYASATGTFSWVPQPGIGSSAISDGAINATKIAANTIVAGIVNGTTITGANLHVYSGTPAKGNLLLSISSVSVTDDYGNSIVPGVNLYGANGASVGITDDGSTANIQLQPASVTQLSDVPQVYASSNSPGTGTETQFLFMSSGATNNNEAAQIQLQGEAGDRSTPAQIQFLFGGTPMITFDSNGIGSVDIWKDISGSLVNWQVNSGGIARYKKMPDNTVMIQCTNVGPVGTPTSGVLWNIPTGYQDTSGATYNFPVVWASSTVPSLTANPSVYVRGSTLEVGSPIPSSITSISFVIRYPID